MERRVLQCDICGNRWDITNTQYAFRPCPGTAYIHQEVKNNKRNLMLQKLKVTSDDRMEREDIDICDCCYYKIDKFIGNIINEEE